MQDKDIAKLATKAAGALLLWASTLSAPGCMDMGDPYPPERLRTVSVQAGYPGDAVPHAGADVRIENIPASVTYSLRTDAYGKAEADLPDGIYRISVRDRDGQAVYNGAVERVVVDGVPLSVRVDLVKSRAGGLVFREIYFGGCLKTPEEGTYQSDQFIVIHNNDDRTVHLDGLCLGTLSPYNSNASNPWTDADGRLPEFVPVVQAVWMIGGDGTSFPLEKGGDAVVCLRGAIDHKATYPMSVDLDRPGYFVCYNPLYFPNPTYHPVPGGNIDEDHHLEVVVKTGQANAYTVSVTSPAMVIFRAPEGTDIHEYLAREGGLAAVPGSSVDKVAAIPEEWVVDAVEVFNGSSSVNHKRLRPTLDAGYVLFSESFRARTVVRRVDEQASGEAGYTILQDTNDSSHDMYESTGHVI